MSQPDYARIAPLITAEEQSGRTLRFAFTCPVSGKVVEGRATVPQAAGAGGQLADRAARSVGNEVRWSVARAIRQALGHHSAVGRILGDLAGSLLDTAARAATDPDRLSARERQQAAVEAFQSVASQWLWDEGRGGYITTRAAQESMSAFELLLLRAPVTAPYDRAVCARMMAELSSADERISRDEEAFLLEFLDPSVTGISDLAGQPPLSDAELAEVSAGEVRRTLLTLAWALALCDEDLAAPERARLSDFARGLGMGQREEREAISAAQLHVLEQVLDRVVQLGGGFTERTRAQIVQAAERLGMSEAEAHAAEARYRKRAASS